MWRVPRIWGVVSIVLVLFAGCERADSEYPPKLPLDAAYTECEEVEDCVVVELGCCDACNGGHAVAVNASHEGDVKERYREGCGEGKVCTEIGCLPWVLSCFDNTCGMTRGATYER
jgi:hypothetical protein